MDLIDTWLRLWNNDLTLAEKIVSPDFVAHAAPLVDSGSDEIRGRDGLTEWIAGTHATIRDLEFTVAVGPIADRDFVVVRWHASGTSAVGPVSITGTDILRLVDGMIVEYWLNADSLQLARQVGLIPQA
ncbi:ester cyclase [Kutzneria sp. 744]|uniref:ester cyclase n=1 Tax=Kutzneria sp. (strain 744) TaxID=345341 RepID=UPI0003EEC697|nr:ester cyclase [Kutzneria sp. 744]EWM10814.1 hypothetical protein KUTG_01118 [Kutzneria sp. 744]